MTFALVLVADDSTVSPGLLGFVVVAALGVATWLLIRSMNRQLRKIDVPRDADQPSGAARTVDPEGEPPDGDRTG